MKKLLAIICFVFFITACSVDSEIKPILKKDDVLEIIPQGWPQPSYNFNNNPLTIEGFTLGRTLFYEPILSADNTISCGSCHQQFAAFSHSGHDVSHGIDGLLGTRNAPAIQNINWNSSFMHDGGILNIEVMPLAPITNPVEMNENMPHLISKLSVSAKYKQLFKEAFGDEQINSQRIFKAITQFMGTLYSYNSKYDRVKSGKENFTSTEASGYELFTQKCVSCHTEPLFTDHSFRNIGLKVNDLYNDSGRAHITGNPSDKFKFKTPSLRNVEKTGPYMHDGRFTSLNQCLDHYVFGITNSNTLDPLLTNGIFLTNQNKSDLIAFLKTLTDNQFLTDKRFSDPN